MEQKYNFSEEDPCVNKKHVARRKWKVIKDLVGRRIPDITILNEHREGCEDLEEKALNALYSPLLCKQFRCRADFVQHYSCLTKEYDSFKDDLFILNAEGPCILENMQYFYERKARSTLLRADKFVEKNEENMKTNVDALKVKEIGHLFFDFENNENSSSSSEEDINDNETFRNFMNKL